ncbi:MAG: DoxX family protein [Candidatus Staskawiczbacteria bacterium]
MKINFKPNNLLRIFLGLVFTSAGLYRIFNWQSAILELPKLNLNSVYLSIFIITLEIIGGLLLIFNIKTKKVLLGFIVFLTITLIWALIISGKSLLGGISELFTFDLNPTDFFLHFTYLIILIYLLTKKSI